MRQPFYVFAGRVLLLTLAAGAFVWSGLRRADRVWAVDGYVCPMHPQVRSDSAGDCPICGMALEKIESPISPGGAAAPESRFTTARLSDVEKSGPEGHYIMRPVMFTESVQAPAWVESHRRIVAQLHADEARAMSSDRGATFSPAETPNTTFSAHLTDVPPQAWDASTLLVRFDIDSNEPLPPPGHVGWLTLAPLIRTELLIPQPAVLQDREGPYAWVASPSGADEKRRLTLGKYFFRNAVVIAGVRKDEAVAMTDLFFLDAERRSADLRGASAPMGP